MRGREIVADLPRGKEEQKTTKKLKNDIELAMLGVKEAAKRLTDKGMLLPCPMCGKILSKKEESFRIIKLKHGSWEYSHYCKNDEEDINCEISGSVTVYGHSKVEVIQKWNTRTPFLSKEILEKAEK